MLLLGPSQWLLWELKKKSGDHIPHIMSHIQKCLDGGKNPWNTNYWNVKFIFVSKE